MKLTKAKKEWVHKKVEYYCSLLKCPVPKIFLTMSEYDHWKTTQREKTGYNRVGRSSSSLLGVCHGNFKSANSSSSFIVILIKRVNKYEQLDYIIRHELLHWAKPSYNHYSREFADRMEKLKKGKLNENGRFIK